MTGWKTSTSAGHWTRTLLGRESDVCHMKASLLLGMIGSVSYIWTFRSRRSTVLMGPFGEGQRGERTIVIARLARDLDPQPGRSAEHLMLGSGFNLCNDEAGILPKKCVNFPHMPLVGHERAALFDHRSTTQRQHGFGFDNGDVVFEFEAL